MITKTNRAVTYTAESANGSYKLIAEVKTNADETDLLSVLGSICRITDDNPNGIYIGSFSRIESSLSININDKDVVVFATVSAAVTDFITELTTTEN